MIMWTSQVDNERKFRHQVYERNYKIISVSPGHHKTHIRTHLGERIMSLIGPLINLLFIV